MGTTIIGIMNIIQTKPQKHLPVWWGAWLALLLIVFGAPLLLARVLEMPGDAVQVDLLSGRAVSLDAIGSLIDGRERAAAIIRSGSLYGDLSMAFFEKAQRYQGADQATLYKESEYWQRRALMVAPVDAYGWFRLAYLLFSRHAQKADVTAAWRQSFFSAPYEPRLLLPRIRMALDLGEALDETSRGRLPTLIRQAWEVDPTALAKAAKEEHFITVAEDALRGDPQAIKYFRDQLDLLP